MKYNTAYKCTYHIYENDDELSDAMYRKDLMGIFNLADSDDFDICNVILSQLHDQLKDVEVLTDCMKQAAASLLTEDTQIGLCMLYSYDYMYITHQCICEYLDTEEISPHSLNVLQKKVFR